MHMTCMGDSMSVCDCDGGERCPAEVTDTAADMTAVALLDL